MASSTASFTLAEFVKSHDLPKTVVVTRGYSCGEADEEESLSNGELITLHSVQQSQVVQAKDHLNRMVLLPVVGARKYELLPEEARLDSVIYETAGDIVNDEGRPKKVRVTAAVDTGDDESSIYADDILEINSIESRPGTHMDRVLVATNQLGEKLRLPLATPGKFSPQLDVKWYSMVEIINLGVFPQRVHLVSTQTGHRHRGHDKFVLLKTELETNVLITVNKELLALSLSAEIEVALHEVADEPSSNGVDLSQTAQPAVVIMTESASTESDSTASGSSKLASTNPFLVEMMADSDESGPCSPRGSIQEDLLSLSKEDRLKVKFGSVRKFGRQPAWHEPAHADIESDTPEQMVEIYERLQEKMAETIRLREDANKWRSRCQRLESQQDSNKKQLAKLQKMADFWRKRVEATQTVDDDVLQSLKDYISNPMLVMSDTLPAKPRQDVKPDVQKVGVAVMPTIAQPAKKPAPGPSAFAADKLSIADVQRLLTTLNLQQYTNAFRDEQVDGGLLLELDDDSLQQDLGMKSALHRKKLLRTIQGRGTPLHELLAR